LKISIVGSGYVGSVTGICLAELGHEITLVDVDREKIESIRRGISPVFEPDLDAFLEKNRSRITPTTDLSVAVLATDVTFIAVGTPSRENGSIDLSYVEATSREIGQALKGKQGFHLVIVKSTVLPGTAEHVVAPLIEKESDKKPGKDFSVASNPEFLREGIAVRDFFHPDRIVIGVNESRSQKILEEIYSGISSPYYVTTIKTAEMIKYVSNAFLATKISFANEIGKICKAIDIDAYNVFDGVGMDARIGSQFFRAGIGFGGSCFPKDVRALVAFAKESGIHPNILEATMAVNESQPLSMIRLLKRHIPDLRGKRIGILGLAFKPDTDDIRESRALPIITDLVTGGADVIAYDPKAADNFRKVCSAITFANRAEEVLLADAVLIVTEWPEFERLDYRGKIVIDGRRVGQAKKTAGVYEGVCW